MGTRVLGDTFPQTLLDSMVWMVGLYFALCSGAEHRNFKFDCCGNVITLARVGGGYST